MVQPSPYQRIMAMPFFIGSFGAEAGITLEEEIAAVACLAFCRRRRTKIIAGKLEGIKAISKMYYPLMGIPRNNGCFILDGIGFLGFAFKDIAVPDMLQFTESLRMNSIVLRKFMETLDYGARLFTDIVKGTPRYNRINYLVGERKLLETLRSLSERSLLFDLAEKERPMLLLPRLQMSHLKNTMEEITKTLDRLSMEISMLRYTLRVLESEVNGRLEALSRESAIIMREYRRREREIEAEVDERIRHLEEERLKEIARVEGEYEKKVRSLLREKERAERALIRSRILLEKSAKRRGARSKSARAKMELYALRVEELTKRIKDLNKAIEEAESEKNNTVKNIRRKYDALIMGERSKIDILRESRDADASRINENIEKIKKSHAIIEESIMKIINEKDNLMRIIKMCSLPISLDEIAVIGVPFYLVVYEGRGRRLDLHPPATFSGVIGNILGYGLERRMSLLLQYQNEAWSAVMSAIMENWDKDSHLKCEVDRIINEENMLLSRDFMDALRRGLEGLREKGWLSDREENTILSFYDSKVE